VTSTVRVADCYTLARTIESPNASGDYFGVSLAASDDELLVGIPFYGHPTSVAGRVERYELTTGTLVQAYVTPRPGVVDAFGWAMASAGDEVVVGAPLDDLGFPMGRAFVFDGSAGTLLHTLDGSGYQNNAFGYAVTAYEGDAVAGLASQSESIGNVLRYDVTTGLLAGSYTDPLDERGFGISLLAQGSRVLVGHSEADSVHAFDGDTGAYLDTLPTPDPNCGSFGTALAAIGDDFVVTSKRPSLQRRHRCGASDLRQSEPSLRVVRHERRSDDRSRARGRD
jgi:hypothetical protein